MWNPVLSRTRSPARRGLPLASEIVNFTVSLAKQGPGVLLYVIAYENILNYSVYAIFISIYIGYKL